MVVVPTMGRVAVAMSGGVDSSVSALLLKRRGVNVEGIFMKNWDERDESGVCNADKEYNEVQRICEKLDIPCRQVNFVKQYWNEVFSQFLEDYQRGLTPNPDVLCNHKIKFGSLFAEARRGGATHLATGHYARVGSFLEEHQLLMAADANKDQTYFLAGLPSKILRSTLFPVGELLKSEVKAMAHQHGLDDVAAKKESMGICFIGKRNFSPFLRQYLVGQPGPIVHVNGRELGHHEGVQFHTLGQGARLHSQKQRCFVVGKHVGSSTLFVDDAPASRAIHSSRFVVGRLQWTNSAPAALATPLGLRCAVRIRHRHPLAPATVRPSAGHTPAAAIPLPVLGHDPHHRAEQAAMWTALQHASDCVVVDAEHPLCAVTPGQAAVFYCDGVCLGGGTVLATQTLADEE